MEDEHLIPDHMAQTDEMPIVTVQPQQPRRRVITPKKLGLVGTTLAVVLTGSGIALNSGCASNAHSSPNPNPTTGINSPTPGIPTPTRKTIKDFFIKKGTCQTMNVQGDESAIYQGDGTVNGVPTYDTGPHSTITAAEAVMQHGTYTICATQGDGDIQKTETEEDLEAALGQDTIGAIRRSIRLTYVVYYDNGELVTQIPNY